MKHIFVINPAAGKRDYSALMIKEIKTVFLHENYEILITEKPGDATNKVEQIAKQNEAVCFYSCGGDGTLNEVIKGMYRYPNACVGIIPIGTGNDFIKSFVHLSRGHFMDLKRQLHGRMIKTDLLKVNDQICVNIASVGLDAAVAKNVIKFKRFPFLKENISYQLSVVYSFFTSMKNQYQVIIDGIKQPPRSYIFIVAANGKCYGGGYFAAPNAKLDDGYIDVVTVKTIPRIKTLPLIRKYKNGLHDQVDQTIISHQPAKKLTICHSKDFFVNIDGEILKTANLDISVLSKQLNVWIPSKIAINE